ncbi:MAG: CehA/McbA family metallohydrolase, partial [Sinomicrobium sp.]|nr:CehA/McbA family metallohydrolase [Sinomicrobium sp.]
MKQNKLLFLLSLLLFSCKPATDMVSEEENTVWFKGNTHVHTIICGHADTAPDSVARWYLARDYNFLICSEHNFFIDPDSVQLPPDRRQDFILIPGEEVTGRQAIHTTGMNLKKYVEGLPKPSPTETKTEMMQHHTDSILLAGGLPILNHPNFVSGAQASDILGVKRLHLFELYNGHPLVYNWGNDIHKSVEAKWDSLLTAGMLVLGVSSDDAHQFQAWSADDSNPGRGWVMVDSKGVLSADAITQAMAQGNFYATNGVMMTTVAHQPDHYRIEIDTNFTKK